jgi:hypothetical protein
MWQGVKRGDRFWSPAGVVEVIRVSRSGTWVDIRVHQWPRGATWTKRMPRGIPARWFKV